MFAPYPFQPSVDQSRFISSRIKFVIAPPPCCTYRASKITPADIVSTFCTARPRSQDASGRQGGRGRGSSHPLQALEETAIYIAAMTPTKNKIQNKLSVEKLCCLPLQLLRQQGRVSQTLASFRLRPRQLGPCRVKKKQHGEAVQVVGGGGGGGGRGGHGQQKPEFSYSLAKHRFSGAVSGRPHKATDHRGRESARGAQGRRLGSSEMGEGWDRFFFLYEKRTVVALFVFLLQLVLYCMYLL